MAITIYSDVIMSNSVMAAGVRGKNMRRNTRSMSFSGLPSVNVDWARTQRQFEVGFVPMLPTAWAALEGLFEVTDAGAYGFLMQDPKDASATHATGAATGITSTTFQLQKTYTSVGGTRTKARKISRPLATGFVVNVNSVLLAPANYTLNTVTGVLTIPSAPAANLVTWLGSFYVPVHFANDAIDWDLVLSGPESTRLMAGPSVVLMEVPE